MSKIDNGGPAFPLADSCCEYGGTNRSAANGMTLRQYAAIKLRVPDSGLDWLDRMIRESQRDEFSAKAMAALIQSELLGDDAEIAPAAYEVADAMLAARKEGAA